MRVNKDTVDTRILATLKKKEKKEGNKSRTRHCEILHPADNNKKKNIADSVWFKKKEKAKHGNFQKTLGHT